MPRYFFDLRPPDGRVIRDDFGVELADDAAALREALDAARGFAEDRNLGHFDYSGWYFEIRNDTRSILTAPVFLIGLAA